MEPACGLQFLEGGHQRLSSAEAQVLSTAVRDLTRGGKSAQELTLLQFKTALRKPLATVLGLLARMEAGYWTTLPGGESAVTSLPYVEVDDALRAQAAEVLSWPWVQQLDAKDLRFAMPDGTTAHDWVAGQAKQLRAHRALPEVLNALSCALSVSVRALYLSAAQMLL